MSTAGINEKSVDDAAKGADVPHLFTESTLPQPLP
jgi:hypothetical protein